MLIALDCERPRLRWLLRVLVLALLLFTLSLTVLSLFLYGRDDELIRNNSGLFHDAVVVHPDVKLRRFQGYFRVLSQFFQ